MALVGYVRVSTAAQDGALQRDALVKAGCGKLFEDKASGAKSDRPGLNDALAYIRAGDGTGGLEAGSPGTVVVISYRYGDRTRRAWRSASSR